MGISKERGRVGRNFEGEGNFAGARRRWLNFGGVVCRAGNFEGAARGCVEFRNFERGKRGDGSRPGVGPKVLDRGLRQC